MWKFLNESVEGTSHRSTGSECQDSSFASPFEFETDNGVILACSDGAGSAKHPKLGSAITCDVAVRQAMSFLEAGHSVGDATPDVVRAWMNEINAALCTEASALGAVPRDLACTLLLAVIGATSSIFAQVGDGGIVLRDGAEYQPVFWPQTGEYQNTTFFVTDPQFDKNVQVLVRPGKLEEIALFSDGLQMLALNFGKRSAHQPFFSPLFSALRATPDHNQLIVPMRQWLDSAAINARTDDDKTLVLAAKVMANGDAVV